MPDHTRADLKALLAQAGMTLKPEATITRLTRPPEGTPANVLVLDRVEAREPAYCTHGYATCVSCNHLCWMGHETSKALAEGDLLPICRPCANRMIPPDHKLDRHIVDHLRADGPHDD